MRVDPRVSRAKFENELAIADKQLEVLQAWGCWIVRREYPTVDAVFMPRHPLRFTAPFAPQQIVLLADQPPMLASFELPMLAARAFGVRVGLDDYDQRPPSVTFRDPWSWDPLPFDTMLRANHVDDGGRPFAVLLPDHPITHRPFLCMRGVREYHEHPQHTGDDWMLYRGHMGLFTVLSTIWRTCVENAHPNLVATPAGLQVAWEVAPPALPPAPPAGA